MQQLFREEALQHSSAQSLDLNPKELLWDHVDCVVHKKCPSRQSNLWEVYRVKYHLSEIISTTKSLRLITAHGGFFDKSRIWWTQVFKLKILISNYVKEIS